MTNGSVPPPPLVLPNERYLVTPNAHYAFVAIHPFADGNGRVARALASVFTYRAYSVPVLILAESRNDYLTNLEAADRSNH
jgi:Fic family protein